MWAFERFGEKQLYYKSTIQSTKASVYWHWLESRSGSISISTQLIKTGNLLSGWWSVWTSQRVSVGYYSYQLLLHRHCTPLVRLSCRVTSLQCNRADEKIKDHLCSSLQVYWCWVTGYLQIHSLLDILICPNFITISRTRQRCNQIHQTPVPILATRPDKIRDRVVFVWGMWRLRLSIKMSVHSWISWNWTYRAREG